MNFCIPEANDPPTRFFETARSLFVPCLRLQSDVAIAIQRNYEFEFATREVGEVLSNCEHIGLAKAARDVLASFPSP